MSRNWKGITVLPRVLLAVCLLVSAGLNAGEMVHSHPATAVEHDGTDPHAQHRAMLASQRQGTGITTSVQLRDLTLLDQDGKPVRFASDVVGDRIVVIDFVYTTCTTVCPVLSAVFGQVQKRLEGRLGNEVMLVSVSVDPGRDTPQRLKAYATSHHADSGWVWLTGEKTSVDAVLDGLGAYTPNFEDHPSMVLVGDGRSGNWSRFFGFPGPDQIMAVVDKLAMARQTTAAQQTMQE